MSLLLLLGGPGIPPGPGWSELITLGIGTPSDVPSFLLLGLTSDSTPPVIPPPIIDALVLQGLLREIGDVITVSEVATGLSAVPVVIQAVNFTVHERHLMIRWRVAPLGTSTVLILDDPIYGVLDAAEATLGYA